MMKASRGVKILGLIGAISLLTLALACAKTTLPSIGDGKAVSGYSSIERVTLTNNDFRAELTTEGSAIVAGQPTSLVLNVKNAQGELVRDLQTVHEKPIHLILVSDDLAEFNHLHPEARTDGSYSVNFTFPHGGGYRLYADFTPAGTSQTVEQYKVTVGGAPAPRVDLVEDKSLTESRDGLRVTMQPSGALRAGEERLLEFMVVDEATGKPVTDLQPYLGSLAHFVIITEDASKYLHVHPMEGGAMLGVNHDGMDTQMNAGPTPKDAGKVTVSAHTTFPNAGLYKLWAQFQRAGRVITIPFVLRVSDGETAASKPEVSDSVPPDAIKITLSGAGYEPSRIEVKQGQAVKLAFYRTDAKNCSGEVVFPSLGIRKPLPVGQTTLVEVMPRTSGELAFTCGGGMYRGSLVVSE